MRLRVLMFGALGEAAERSAEVDVDEPATVDRLLDAVRAAYPDASPIVDRCRVAVNHEIVDDSHALTPDDEIAILPPVSGGDRSQVLPWVWVRLSSDPSPSDASRVVATSTAGAVVTFTGTVRDRCDRGPVDRLEYTAYEVMAQAVMEAIGWEAAERWALAGVAIDHAVGSREAGAVTFVVACAAAHRDEAFDACRYVTDEVKRRAPIWKKEIGPWGARWAGL